MLKVTERVSSDPPPPPQENHSTLAPTFGDKGSFLFVLSFVGGSPCRRILLPPSHVLVPTPSLTPRGRRPRQTRTVPEGPASASRVSSAHAEAPLSHETGWWGMGRYSTVSSVFFKLSTKISYCSYRLKAVFYDLARCLAPSLRGPVVTLTAERDWAKDEGGGRAQKPGPQGHGAPSRPHLLSTGEGRREAGGGGAGAPGSCLALKDSQCPLPARPLARSLIHLGFHVLGDQSFIHSLVRPSVSSTAYTFIY